MEQTEICVIGGGVIGLACARKLAETGREVVLSEKETTFGRHISSRNSEVIHSGIYYPYGSLKHKLCIRGRELLYSYLKKNNLPHKQTGKLIVAVEKNELAPLYALYEQGKKNKVEELQLLDAAEIKSLEPQVKAISAVFSPLTGIFDSHKFMKSLETDLLHFDGIALYQSEVIALQKADRGWVVNLNTGEQLQAEKIINCAGLNSAEIAQKAGIKLPPELTLHFSKGEYFKTNKIKNIEHLVYPIPPAKSNLLGIHLTINLNGDIRFGPNAYYIRDLDYKMDETYKKEFYFAVTRYLDIAYDDLEPDDTGIRPRLQGERDAFRDFYIDYLAPDFLHLTGIESPGLTASLAIAEYVASLF